MKLIHRERIDEFTKLYTDSLSSLSAWLKNIEINAFKNPIELKKTFGSADYVKPFWVFNISSNKYRLIALIDFTLGVVSIEYVLIHSEYDKGKWR